MQCNIIVGVQIFNFSDKINRSEGNIFFCGKLVPGGTNLAGNKFVMTGIRLSNKGVPAICGQLSWLGDLSVQV